MGQKNKLSSLRPNKLTTLTTTIAQVHTNPSYYVYYDAFSWAVADTAYFSLQNKLDIYEEFASKKNVERFCELFGILKHLSKPELNIRKFDERNNTIIVEMKSWSRPDREHLLTAPYVKKGKDPKSILNNQSSYFCECERELYSQFKSNLEPRPNKLIVDKHKKYVMNFVADNFDVHSFNISGSKAVTNRNIGNIIDRIGSTYEKKLPAYKINIRYVKKNAIDLKYDVENNFFPKV